jgi:hypothetical protein
MEGVYQFQCFPQQDDISHHDQKSLEAPSAVPAILVGTNFPF